MPRLMSAVPAAYYNDNADFWVIEYLMEQDGMPDPLIKAICDSLNSSQNNFPPIVQLRLMFRVLRGNMADVTPDTLKAVECLGSFISEPKHYPPTCDVTAAAPSSDLLRQASGSE